MKLINQILVFLILISHFSFGQNGQRSLGPLKITSLSGEAFVLGKYYADKRYSNDTYTNGKFRGLSGGISGELSSYVWVPQFITLNLNGEYNPGINRYDYIVMPDHSESANAYRLNVSGQVFHSKFISMNFRGQISERYIFRDNFNKIKSNTRSFGSSIALSKYLPTTIAFDNFSSQDVEEFFDRRYNRQGNNIIINSNKNFGERDNTSLSYSHRDLIAAYNDNTARRVLRDRLRVRNVIKLGRDNRFRITSMWSSLGNKGVSANNLHSFNENVSMELPYNLNSSGGYMFSLNKNQNGIKTNQGFQGSLTHQLYQSLSSKLFTISNYSSGWGTRSTINRSGLQIKYKKNLITNGKLLLNYNYTLERTTNKSENQGYWTYDEAHIISDGNIVVLNGQSISTETITIKDSTGVVTYQEDFDYLIIQQGVFTEIQRIPGGQIANNSTILVDYMVNQERLRITSVNKHDFSGSIYLFKGFFNLYYHGSRHKPNIPRVYDENSVYYLNSNTLGCRLSFRSIKIEGQYSKSIGYIPFDSYRLSAEYMLRIQNRIRLFISGMYSEIDYKRSGLKFEKMNAIARVDYQILPKTSASLYSIYDHHIGPNEYELLSSNFEISTNMRSTDITLGYRVYYRVFNEDNDMFNGIQIKIIRRFN